jgi:hypothetical protein
MPSRSPSKWWRSTSRAAPTASATHTHEAITTRTSWAASLESSAEQTWEVEQS